MMRATNAFLLKSILAGFCPLQQKEILAVLPIRDDVE